MPDLKSDLASLRLDRQDSGPRRRWLLFALAFLCLAAGGYAAWLYLPSSSVLEVEIVRPLVARPGEAPRRVPVLTASGYVVARKKAVVSAKIQGRLSDLRVEEGSRVKEGDVIARLESTDQEAQVERAKAAVERAAAELEENRRQLRLAESLVAGGVVSGDDLDAAKSRVRIAEAAIRQTQADLGVFEAYLQNTYIKAPFTGVVIKKMAEVGESVAPIPPGVNVSTSSGAIVALADFDTLEVEVDVNESHIAKLNDAHPAEVTVEAFPDRKFQAVLRQIIPSADRTKATVMVKVTILEKLDQLKPEMSARVTFLNEEKPPAPAASPGQPVITIPRQAVVTQGGATRVFEVAQGKAVERNVVLGDVLQDRVVVRDGLGGTEAIILNPPEALKDGQAVRNK